MTESVERRIEEAREYVTGQYIGVVRALYGEEPPVGNERTRLRLHSYYLRGFMDMANHLKSGGSIADLAKIITRGRGQYRTGESPESESGDRQGVAAVNSDGAVIWTVDQEGIGYDYIKGFER